MPSRRPPSFELRPVADVTVGPTGFAASGREPWLEIQPVAAFRKGSVVEIGYSAGPSDRVARPVLQFRARDGRTWNALLPAASEGAGFWRGRVPPETVEIRVSPTDAPGPFRFAIESLRILTPREMMRLRIANPRRGIFATGARMVQLREEADLNLRFLLERAETQNFETWRARRRRPAPPQAQLPASVIVVVHDAVSPEALARTCDSLLAQTHSNWRLRLDQPSAPAAEWTSAQADARIASAGRGADADYAIFLSAGDRLAPHALAAFIAAFVSNPSWRIVYSDDARYERARLTAQPHFKPDWSPTRQAYAPYVGRAAMLRADLMQRYVEADAGAPQALVDAALADAPPDSIGHVARILLEAADAASITPRRSRKERPAAPTGRRVTIVIPSRDKIQLLARCLDSIFARTRYADYDVLVVDNGSVEPRTLATLEKYKRAQAHFDVAPNPMPFNFSALCNFGAARAKGDVLVFLNNDTVVLQPRWIEHMLEFASQPDIGAVGCKLLYPTGRVQHAGVVLGMGGVAGHFGEGLGRRAAGWLGGSLGPHETSAVTAACLMIEKGKFEAIGGFDAEHLPVDLNDIDLCLRLNAKGWRTICDCRVMLAHHQSASRGGSKLRLQKVYRREREYFLRTWGAAIRSDPFFNPNLSLYDREPKLG